MTDLIRLIDLTKVADARGTLVALEGEKDIPFAIRRIYCITDVPRAVTRGFHAHKKLQQIAVCLYGRCRIVLDNGRQREGVWLDSPSRGLLIGDAVWREMSDFSPGAVLMVIASEYYDEADYIRDYQAFLDHLSNSA
jgi:dTDP-4-dehydrorhamnose 3,5-epimerase-like enzyme